MIGRLRIWTEPSAPSLDGRVVALDGDGSSIVCGLRSASGATTQLMLDLPQGCQPPFRLGDDVVVKQRTVTRGIHVNSDVAVLDSSGELLAAVCGTGDAALLPRWTASTGEPLSPVPPLPALIPGAPLPAAVRVVHSVSLRRGDVEVQLEGGTWSSFRTARHGWIGMGEGVSWTPGVAPADAVSSLWFAIVRSTPPIVAEERGVFHGSWLDERGRAMRVEAGINDELRVTVLSSLTGGCFRRHGLPLGAPLTYQMRGRATSERATIEVGAHGLGPTYDLIADGDRLLPSVGAGLHDDDDDDLGVPWAFPLSPWRRASAAEAEALRGSLARLDRFGWLSRLWSSKRPP